MYEHNTTTRKLQYQTKRENITGAIASLSPKDEGLADAIVAEDVIFEPVLVLPPRMVVATAVGRVVTAAPLAKDEVVFATNGFVENEGMVATVVNALVRLSFALTWNVSLQLS